MPLSWPPRGSHTATRVGANLRPASPLAVLALAGCGRRGKGAVGVGLRRGIVGGLLRTELSSRSRGYRPPGLSPPLIAAQPSRRALRMQHEDDGVCRRRVTLLAPSGCVGLNPGGQNGSSVTVSQFTSAAVASAAGKAHEARAVAGRGSPFMIQFSPWLAPERRGRAEAGGQFGGNDVPCVAGVL